MILPNFVLLSRAGLKEKFTGMDSEEFCQDPQMFLRYPYEVDYNYNSRGFRDTEWPDDLVNAIWCFGDSFTVGIGCPQQHAWPAVLQRKTGTKCINISLDGASNQWIAKKVISLSQSIRPQCMVVHWSYIHRRESSSSKLSTFLNDRWNEFYCKIKDCTWPDCTTASDFDKLPETVKKEILEIHAGPAEQALLNHRLWADQIDDEDRRLYFDPNSNESADIENTINCIADVHALGVNVIHSFVPRFASMVATKKIIEYLDQLKCCYIPPFRQLDCARDGHHYDLATAEFFTDKIIQTM